MVNVGAEPGSRRTELSRVTLVGQRRRVDVLLPSDEPIGRLLPDALRLVDDRVATQPTLRHLVTSEGEVLPHSATLASAEVPDGAVLRVVLAHDVPAAPVVHDISDEVADDLGVRRWRWTPAARQWTAVAAAPLLAAAVAVLARHSVPLPRLSVVLAVLALVAALVGVVPARLGNRELGAALIVTGGALGAVAAWTAADAHHWGGGARLAATAGAVAVALLLLGVLGGLGRGGVIGAAAVAVLIGVWEITLAVEHGGHTADQRARVGAVLVVVSVIVLGLLPGAALAAAGLTGLDDKRAGGTSVSRYDVGTALAATHRGLVLAAVVTAASAVGGGLLAVATHSWAGVLLAALLGVVLLSRARAYPLIAEVVALVVAALVVLVRLGALWVDTPDAHPAAAPAVLALAVLLPLAVLAVRPPEHVQVRLRRALDLCETISLVALFPLAVGVFGVYERLVHAL